MEFMKSIPDNFYDLAIVDPPYGLGNKTTEGGSNKKNSQVRFKNHSWDNSIPNKDYFNELKRVSRNQIIWGGNYMAEFIGNTKCVLIWDKMTYIPTMSQFEFAFCSINKHPKLIKINSNDNNRFHPTQKPVKLYKWILTNYAQKGDKILDTHGGSMSIALACYDLGFDLDICELDKDYFDAGIKRFEQHKKQLKLF